MRRLQAILLLLFFCALQSMPVLGLTKDSDGALPACCRRDGKHHCAMMMMESVQKSGHSFQTIAEKCPCPMHPSVSSQSLSAGTIVFNTFYAGIQSHPACHAQSEARYRISFDRSRQKRGPPSSSLSA